MINRKFLKFLFCIHTFTFSATSSAIDVVKVVTRDCQSHDGLLVSVEAEKAKLLRLDGRSVDVPLESINVVAVYNVYENPIGKIQLTDDLQPLLKDYYPKGEKMIRGWAIRYIQNLVFVYDIEGYSHVLDLYDIQKIRDPELGTSSRTVRNEAKVISLSTNEINNQCQLASSQSSSEGKSSSGSSVIATRIMSDKVQISDYMSNYEKGMRKLRSYEERTYLYPKPFIYEDETSMGILVANSDRQNDQILLLPVHFKWSNGQPYRFQSRTLIGGSYVKAAATLDPLNVLESEVKSHAFHATFIGNLNALPAGTEFYSAQRDTLDLDPGEDLEDVSVTNAFNYTALMGGDYKKFSLSAGFYYPTYRIQGEGEFREILGSELSPVFRFRYFADNWTFRVLGSFTDMEESNTVSDKQISIGTDTSVEGVINEYAFEAQWIRAGIDFQVTDEIEVSLDSVILNGSYEEVTALSENNSIDFQDFNQQIWISQRFGNYTRVRGYYIHYNLFRDYDIASRSGNESQSYGSLGGVFEIIF